MQILNILIFAIVFCVIIIGGIWSTILHFSQDTKLAHIRV